MIIRRRFTRRQLIKGILSGTCGAAVHRALSPTFVTNVFAQSRPRGEIAIPDGLLCVINLAGGASLDHAPIHHDAWYDANPTLAYLPGESLSMASDQGLHPALTAFKQYFDDGDLCIINKVGYSNHSRSHPVASARWMRGTSSDDSKRQGIINSISCQLDGLLPAVSLSGSSNIAIGTCEETRTMQSIAGFAGIGTIGGGTETPHLNMARRRLLQKITQENLNTDILSFANESITSTDQLIEQVLPLIQDAPSGVTVPGFVTGQGRALIDDMVDVARFFRSRDDIGVRCAYAGMGGYDTHSNARQGLTNLLTDLNAAVRYLVEAAKADGYFNKLIIMVMSEFGRTIENDSLGQDHGGPCPAYLIGGALNGRQVNAAPSNSEIISRLPNRFLNDMDVDTRTLWANVLWNGLGIDPTLALDSQDDSPFSLENLNLFKS